MKISFTLILALFLINCSRDVNNSSSENPIITTVGYFKGKIEGTEKTVKNIGNTHYVEWTKQKDSYDRIYYGVSVMGYYQGFDLHFRVFADNIELNKEYTMVYTNEWSKVNVDFDYSETCGAPTCSSYWGCSNDFYGVPTGKVIFTAFDGKKMSGKVEAKVNHQYYGMTSNQTRIITEGVFENAEKSFNSL